MKYRMEHIESYVRVWDEKKEERRKTKQKWIKVESSEEQQVDQMHSTIFPYD